MCGHAARYHSVAGPMLYAACDATRASPARARQERKAEKLLSSATPWGRTRINLVQHQLADRSELKDRLLGFVLNKADVRVLERYESYYGKYYYRNYYGSQYVYPPK